MGDHADDAVNQALDEDGFRLDALADGDFGNDPDSFLFYHPWRVPVVRRVRPLWETPRIHERKSEEKP